MSRARSTRWKFLNFVLWALLGCVAGLRGETAAGDVRLTSSRLVEVTPGKIVTASLLVANRGGAEAVYEEISELPEGWQRISPLHAPLVVAAGEQQLRLLALSVPLTAAAGRYDVSYFLVDSRTQTPVAAVKVSVVVQAVVKVELLREDHTDTVIAGDTYELSYRLVNRGNQRLHVALTAETNPSTPVLIDPVDATIEAASSRVIRVLVKTDVAVREAVSQSVGLTARALGPDAGVSVRQSAVVAIIPRVTGDMESHVHLPAHVRVRAATQDGRSGAQAEVATSGYLDEARQHHLDVLLRGPSLDQENVYGLRNEFRLTYQGPKLGLQLGDQSYSLSPLLQRFSYGRGAGVTFDAGPTNVGAFTVQGLETQGGIRSTGAFVRREFTPGFSLQANALHKSASAHATNVGSLGLFSLQPHFKLGDKLDLEVEYAVSTGGQGTESHAYRVHAQGQLRPDVAYAFERIDAGQQFFGQYHGTQSTQAAISFPIRGALRGSAAYNDDLQSFAEPGERSHARVSSRQKTYRPGLMYSMSPQTDVSVDFQHVERGALYEFGAERTLEQSVRLGLGNNRGALSAQTYAEFGTLARSSARTNESSRVMLQRYSAFLSYRPGARHSYSVYATTGSSPGFDAGERTHTFGAAAQWKLSERVSASLNYGRSMHEGASARVQNTATSTVTYTLPNQNVIGVQARWTDNSRTREASHAVAVTYTIPFKIRAGKKQSGAAIQGRVFDVVTKAPLSRVVITANGLTAVTDHHGRFLFPVLKPGVYQLNVEQRSIGTDRVTTELIPLTVELSRGDVAELAIGVTGATRLRVRVARFAAPGRSLSAHALPPTDSLQPAGGVAGTLVELTNGTEILRQLSDADGEVAFDHLRPGRWTLRVNASNIPEHHRIETPELEIELRPEQTGEAVVRVLPQSRPIRFIDEGTVRPSS